MHHTEACLQDLESTIAMEICSVLFEVDDVPIQVESHPGVLVLHSKLCNAKCTSPMDYLNSVEEIKEKIDAAIK